MLKSKRKNLEAKGWKVGNVEEFLQLSPEEAAYVELRLKLSDGLKERRQQRNLTQVEMAKLVKSSESHVAKMEAGDPSVSLDLMIRSLHALGVFNQDLAGIISRAYRTTPS